LTSAKENLLESPEKIKFSRAPWKKKAALVTAPPGIK
jgi:hypothetical protein